MEVVEVVEASMKVTSGSFRGISMETPMEPSTEASEELYLLPLASTSFHRLPLTPATSTSTNFH